MKSEQTEKVTMRNLSEQETLLVSRC